jgi:hypothetical protein
MLPKNRPLAFRSMAISVLVVAVAAWREYDVNGQVPWLTLGAGFFAGIWFMASLFLMGRAEGLIHARKSVAKTAFGCIESKN